MQEKQYINTNWRLRDDKREVGMPEAEFEAITVHAIVDGKSENAAWNACRKLLEICPGAAYLKNIKAL